MVAQLLVIASVACVFSLANGFKAPFPGFKPCKSSDDPCMLQNANDGLKTFVGGISEIGVKSSDPDHHEKIDASTSSLKFILTKVTLTGLKSCKVVKLKRDEPNLKMTLVLECSMKLDGDYLLDGKMLSINIQGNDKIHVVLPKIISTVNCNYIYKKGKDGKKHLRIKNFEHTYELAEKATLVFEGLFKDNEVLRKATNEVVKNNPHEIINEIGIEVFNAVVKRVVENINDLFDYYEYNQLALD